VDPELASLLGKWLELERLVVRLEPEERAVLELASELLNRVSGLLVCGA